MNSLALKSLLLPRLHTARPAQRTRVAGFVKSRAGMRLLKRGGELALISSVLLLCLPMLPLAIPYLAVRGVAVAVRRIRAHGASDLKPSFEPLGPVREYGI